AQPRPASPRQRRRRTQTDRLGVRARRDRRPQPTRLRRGAARREGQHRDRLPAAGDPLLPPLRHRGRAPPDRQRQRLRLRPPPAPAPPPPHQTPAHPPLPPPNKRQSRTLHPPPPQRLGLRRHLPLKPPTHHRP